MPDIIHYEYNGDGTFTEYAAVSKRKGSGRRRIAYITADGVLCPYHKLMHPSRFVPTKQAAVHAYIENLTRAQLNTRQRIKELHADLKEYAAEISQARSLQ